jgi:hypothetical protein
LCSSSEYWFGNLTLRISKIEKEKILGHIMAAEKSDRLLQSLVPDPGHGEHIPMGGSRKTVLARNSTVLDPWTWRPEKVGWYSQVAAALDYDLAWQRVDSSIQMIVRDELASGSDLMYMPFVNISYCDRKTAIRRALQTIIWLIGQSGAKVHNLFSSLNMPESMVIWTPKGPRFLTTSDFRMINITELFDRSVNTLSLDHNAWSVVTSESVATGKQVELSKTLDDAFLQRFDLLRSILPSCAEWILGVVRVVIPCRSGSGRHTCSSDPRFPGVVWLDIRDKDFVLEGLVHEAAHKYFDLAECNAALTVQSDQLFASPLRTEPRSFRSIVIAYHALAFIAAFYREMQRSEIISQRRVRSELADTLWRLRQASRTLKSGEHLLTEAGREFLAHTEIVWQQ